MSDSRFTIRVVIVALVAGLWIWSVEHIWSEDRIEETAEVYCFFENDYYSKGAQLEMQGALRICERSRDGEDRLEWLDPRDVARSG